MSDAVQIVCPSCGAVNRVKADKPTEKAKCGVCHAPLFTGHPVEAKGTMFDKQIARSSVPVVVDVWAPWCGPCRMMGPEFSKAAGQLRSEARLVKLNTEAHPEPSARLGIRGIPTMIAYAAGRETKRQSGAASAAQIVTWVRG